MSSPTPHIPVMLDEVVESLRLSSAEFVVDLTLGAGGHSSALLQAASPDARLLCFDRDPHALEVAQHRLRGATQQVDYVHANYREFGSVLDERSFGEEEDGAYRVDAILLDAGVSSMQLDDGGRGFSWREDAPLDMRMDTTSSLTAGDWLDSVSLSELRDTLRNYGEVKRAGHFGTQIFKARREGRLETTTDLAELCEEISGAAEARKSVHPATLVFQAIRIAVNDELAGLREAVEQIPQRLRRGGRAAVISFHSLEDRIVKRGFRDATREDIPRGVPVRGDRSTEFRLIGGLQRPTDEEVARNPRARSARLRVIERQEGVDA
jgi:16S rRNA (cytosine1402-N4)-methyltransferase